MSTTEDFKNAPPGTLAIHPDGGRAIKINSADSLWLAPDGDHLDDAEMERWGYTLMSAREALDLAWELAHEVKEGQFIHEGTRYLELHSSGLNEYTARLDFRIRPETAPITRTLDPLPEPAPDWLDAPAVLAGFDGWSRDEREVFIPTDDHPDRWVRADTSDTFHWNELRDVTPLYPKGEEA